MIVEDHADFRELMQVLLGRQPDIDVLAQAGSLAEARARAARLELDVAVLDRSSRRERGGPFSPICGGMATR